MWSSQSNALAQAWSRRHKHAHILAGQAGVGPSSNENLPWLLDTVGFDQLAGEEYRPSLETILRVHTPTEGVSTISIHLLPATDGPSVAPTAGSNNPVRRARLWDGGGRRDVRDDAVAAFAEHLSTIAQSLPSHIHRPMATSQGLVLCLVAMSDIDRAVVAEDCVTERMEEALDHLAEISATGELAVTIRLINS
eukprot:COSAG02_NODE_3653_length_6413_cov_4.685144_3_plen_194_part_00